MSFSFIPSAGTIIGKIPTFFNFTVEQDGSIYNVRDNKGNIVFSSGNAAEAINYALENGKSAYAKDGTYILKNVGKIISVSEKLFDHLCYFINIRSYNKLYMSENAIFKIDMDSIQDCISSGYGIGFISSDEISNHNYLVGSIIHGGHIMITDDSLAHAAIYIYGARDTFIWRQNIIDNVVIESDNSYELPLWSVRLIDPEGVIIRNNRLYNKRASNGYLVGISISGGSNISIINNYFYGENIITGEINTTNTALVSMNNISFVYGSNSIDMLGCSESVVSNNIISNGDKVGISLGCKNIIIGNIIDSMLGGIYIDDSENIITGNIITNTTNKGIYEEAGDYNIITNNILISTGGIYTTGANTVKANNVEV